MADSATVCEASHFRPPTPPLGSSAGGRGGIGSEDRPEVQKALQELLYEGGGLKGARLSVLINGAMGMVARKEVHLPSITPLHTSLPSPPPLPVW